MFNPGRDDVRRFFCETRRKSRERLPMTPLESIAAQWIERHPQYHEALDSVAEALVADYPPEAGRSNPFLHLSMHLAVAEQLQIDQPAGIRAAFDALTARTGGQHEAAHEVIDCLGEVLWRAQRDGAAPSDEHYLACLRRRAGLSAGIAGD